MLFHPHSQPFPIHTLLILPYGIYELALLYIHDGFRSNLKFGLGDLLQVLA